jgi:hypothetical protein
MDVRAFLQYTARAGRGESSLFEENLLPIQPHSAK